MSDVKEPAEENINKSNIEDAKWEDTDNPKLSFWEDFSLRCAATKPTRWLRFGIVSLIFFAWVIWLGTWWVALFEFLLLDIYITGYIPFTWWKKSKNKKVYTVMSWIDAIVYALVLVYFVFAYLGQNYQIPSSSLEKTLLTGDYLFVNKVIYGPRVPMTPIHFPLVHNTLPILNCDSYTDCPEVSYKRLKGLRKIERGDIVVFNFPAGDTVMTKVNNPDYYTLVKMFGRTAVINNKAEFGEVKYRPVDRRENYVKRCVAIPGDTLKIINGIIYIDGKALPQPENVQFNYVYQTKRDEISQELFDELGIAADDIHRIAFNGITPEMAAQSGFYVDSASGKIPAAYISPLTSKMVKTLEARKDIAFVKIMPADRQEFLFPEGISANWTRADYGGHTGIVIPAKGMKIAINSENWSTYDRAIRVYEGNATAKIVDGKLNIDGKTFEEYTFRMDYYFMMGDNRDNSLDSRYWGFVPEDHIVGSPWRVIISFDKDKSLFNGGIRWNRVFLDANPDKDSFKE